MAKKKKKRRELPFGLALDPGNIKTGWFSFCLDEEYYSGVEALDMGITENGELRKMLRRGQFDVAETRLLIETPKPRGMPTASEEMDMMISIGRFVQEWSRLGGRFGYVFRMDVKLCLTGRTNSKDPHVRQAILDRFGGEQKGIKCHECKGKGWVGRGRPTCTVCDGKMWEKEPGPLAKANSHIFPAIGVACWWADNKVVQQVITQPKLRK